MEVVNYNRTPFLIVFGTAAYRIMGKHVDRIAERVRTEGSDSNLCPFTTAVLKEDRSMFEVLMQDSRVTNELAVNLIMALFRTGIDSVRYHLNR